MKKTVAPLSLIAKLAEACEAVGGVEKKGLNEFQKYKYVKAADVAKAIRHELFRRGILVIVDEKEFTQTRVIKTNAGGEMPEWLLKCEVTFRDEKEILGPFGAFGVGADTGDKAIYKAKTGALKYVLRGIGLIPDEKDDPEFDEAVDENTDPRAVHAEAKTGKKKREKIKDYQIRGWDSSVRNSGKTAQQIATFLQTRYSATSIAELTPDEFNEAIKWAVGTEDLAKTLQTSTEAVNGKKQPVAAILDETPSDEFDQRIAGD
jgi:hypothetical protein